MTTTTARAAPARSARPATTRLHRADGRDPLAHRGRDLNASCSDGSSGTYHADESIDRLRIFTTDGSPLAAGKTVTIEATIWARSNLTDSDALDLYVTSTPPNPSWSFITTLLPGNVNGQRVLTATFTLSAGGTQAIRGNLRRRSLGGGSASPCTVGNFNDHDDLIFSVAP